MCAHSKSESLDSPIKYPDSDKFNSLFLCHNPNENDPINGIFIAENTIDVPFIGTKEYFYPHANSSFSVGLSLELQEIKKRLIGIVLNPYHLMALS